MALIVTHNRDIVQGKSSAKERTLQDKYEVSGTDNPFEALDETGVPQIDDLYPGTSLKVVDRPFQVKDGIFDKWEITINYKWNSTDSTFPDDPQDGDEFWTYGANLQGFNAKQALSQDAAAGSKAVDNLIGIKDDGSVEGMQWSDAVPTLSVTRWKNAIDIDDAFINGIEDAVGDVNSGTYYGRSAGEMRLMSATIPNQGESVWELNYQFEIKKNTDLADMPTYTKWSDGSTFAYPRGKNGWEYAWVAEKERNSSGSKIVAAEGLYIARRYELNSFSSLGLNGYLFAP